MRLIRIRRHVAEQQAPRPPGGHLLVAIRGFPPRIHKRGMTEEVTAAKNVPSVAVHSPGSDCNSNHTTDKNGETTGSYISNASSQDVDFIQDNTDFQWFLDYGYRDGSPATHQSLHHHASILSSLATSYACDDLSYYDDMAKNLDANLAEVDMENFRTEDIQSILTTLPTMCCGEIQSEREGEMFASVSGSMMAKFDFDSSISPHTSSQGEDSAGSTDTMSICKSELLFSPVKECPLPSTNFSVDSLDCDLLTEHDIMLTCQANKDNYTIAFEGSMTLYSEDSDYHEAGESEATTSESNNWSSTRFVHPSGVRCSSTGGGSRPLDTSMARSDSVYTTWSKLKKRSSEVQLTRHPSGNNNTCPEVNTNFQPVDATALKSQSMPNLSRQRRRCLMSSKLSSAMSSSMESEPRTRPIKLYDVTQHHNSSSLLSAHSETNSSVDGASSCSGGGSRKQHNFSLVKLFMKQKSVSNEGMCYAMDQSSASECWPTSNNSQSEEGESDSYTHNSAVRKRPCPVIGDGSHNEANEVNACGCLNDCRCELIDSGEVCDNGNETKLNFSPGTVENGNNQTKALAEGATDNWIRAEDTVTAGTDYSTCCFEDSLVEPCRQHREESAYYVRQHELIEEEDEGREDSERSESVEQLSESVSKIEEGSSTATLDLGANSCLSSDQQQDDESRPNSSQSDAYSNKSLKPKYNGGINIATKNISLFNVNNNNSIERDDINILVGKRWLGKGTQTRKLGSVGSIGSSPSVSGGESISTYSSSEEVTEPTKLQNLSPSQKKTLGSPIAIATTRNNATQVPVHLMHRSIQTSGYADINTLKSAPFKLLESPNGTSLVKIILPSTKGLGGKSEAIEEMKKPVYVFYPNYALPDLGFLKDKRKELDVAKVFLMPQKFSPPQPPPSETEKQPKAQARTGNGGSDAPNPGKARRPFSCNDMEALRKRGFSHIQDWDSLTFLLPREYRQILAEVPEVVHHLKGRNEDSVRPLFCVSPPLRSGKVPSQRPVSCDCGSLVGGDGKQTNVSSSSSTATQPSSGYRGSSTILSDSSTNHAPSNNYNPLFVYRYDSVSSESSLVMNQKPSSAIQQTPAPPLPKRSISLPSGGAEARGNETSASNSNFSTPPRPPLPRGILRKSMENSGITGVRYNCKAHKNNANSKRYSMFELGNGGDAAQETKNKRRSLQDADFMDCAASPRKGSGKAVNEEARKRISCEKDVDEMEEEYDDEGVDAGTDSSLEDGHLGFEVRPPTPPLPKTPESEAKCCGEEILRLEDFLQLSGLSVICSGESLKEYDETDMTRLRQQVSRFLSAKQNEVRTPNNTPEHRAHPCDGCTNRKKTVSFADNVCVHIRETADVDRASHYTTPPNSPNVSASGGGHKPYQCKLNPPLLDMPIDEEAECSPDGFGSPTSEALRAASAAHISAAQRPVPVDLAQKRLLVTAVSDAVEQIICHFSAAENQAHCHMLGDSSHTPACAHLALSKLCPALYAVFSDGLRPMLDTAFGSIHNSVWQVVEASAQQGPMTKPLNDLVLRLNGEDVLTEGLMKFNAFVFGLLKDRLMNFDIPMMDDVLQLTNRKSSSPDNKGRGRQLNQSTYQLKMEKTFSETSTVLNNNVCSLDAWVGYLRTRESVLRKHYAAEGLLLLANTAGASVRALTDQLLASLQPLSLLPFKLDLLFEVRQLHLSLRRMGSLPQPDVTSPQSASSASPTSSKPWTLMKLVRSIQSSLSQSGDEEGHSAWYHRKQNSSEAQLRGDEPAHHPSCGATSESPPLPDLVDSSCNHKPLEDKPRPRSCVDNTTPHGGFSLVTDIASTVKKRWSGIQLGSKLFQAFDRLAAEDTEEEYSDSLEKQPHGKVTRKRQTSTSSNSDDSNETLARDSSASPVPAVETSDSRPPKLMEAEETEAPCDRKAGAASGGGKFRRLQMKWEMLSGKETNEKVSPGSPSPNQNGESVVGGSSNNASITSSKGCSKIPRLVTSPVRASGIPVPSTQRGATKKVTTPPTPTGSSQLRRPNNTGTKFKIQGSQVSDGKVQPVAKTVGNVTPVVKRQPTAVTRCSRLDQLSSEEQGMSSRVHATRPSSLPYRPASTVQGSRNSHGSGKSELPRRAASSSLNRQKTDANSNQRFVRTLCHRLPSDNGHLSFNEGERLRVVLEVDGKWLLCCRGDQKGLVPRTAVIAIQDRF